MTWYHAAVMLMKQPTARELLDALESISDELRDIDVDSLGYVAQLVADRVDGGERLAQALRTIEIGLRIYRRDAPAAIAVLRMHAKPKV